MSSRNKVDGSSGTKQRYALQNRRQDIFSRSRKRLDGGGDGRQASSRAAVAIITAGPLAPTASVWIPLSANRPAEAVS